MRSLIFSYILCLLLMPYCFAQENNSFADKQICSTEKFQFEIPTPWYYAIPDVTKNKNVARCFLHSRLRVSAEGLLLIDAGKPTASLEKTIDAMTEVMKNGKKDVEIQREDVELDGKKAACLKSQVADFMVPCAVIVHEQNGTVYLVMMSIAKKDDLKNRDLMLTTLTKTWKWKESGAKK
jgi:hypothetical protein